MDDVKYPEIKVQLVGHGGNAFVIVRLVVKALQQAGVPEAGINAYVAEATSGNYDHLLQTTMKWVNVS